MEESENIELVEFWKKVKLAAKEASKAYSDLISASDELANAMEYNKEYVLVRILPSRKKERREIRRIIEWVNNEEEDCKRFFVQNTEDRIKKLEREKLIQKLNLTQDQKQLLGISEE